MLTPEQLAEIEARANAATPGPWGVGDGQCIGLGIENHGPGHYSYDIELAEVVPAGDREPERSGAARQGRDYVVASPEADAEFIAHAREDVSALLAFVREQQQEMQRLLGKLDALEEDSAKLNALETAGVDNWDGYEFAMEILDEEGQ